MLDIRIQAKLLPHNRLVKSIQPAKPKDPRPNNSTTNKANHQHVAKKDESRLTPLRWDGRGGSSRLVTTWPLLMPTKRPDLGCVGAMSPNPLPAHAQTKGEISLSGSREARVSDRLWRRRRGAEGAYLTWRSEPAATEAKP